MNTTRLVAGAAAMLLSIVALAGCSGGSSTAENTTQQSQSAGEVSALPPIIVTPEEAAGTTVIVPLGQVMVLSVDDDVTQWTATVSDESIVEFEAGRDDGSAQFNPGFTPLKEGETTVTVTGPNGESMEFRISVTAATTF